MFKYDYPGQRPIQAFPAKRKTDRVFPSFKPEFRNTDYDSLPQGQYLQQHLLRMGFKFRDIPEISPPMDSSPRFQLHPTRGVSGYPWSSVDGSAGPAPVFRPLGNAESKRRDSASGRSVTTVPAVAAPYRLTGYGTGLPDYTPVGPVFRPIP